MGELEDQDDLDGAGSGAGTRVDDGPLVRPTLAPAAQQETASLLESVLSRLDFMDALDDLAAGGDAGLATSVEIFADGFVHGPDDLLDSFEPVRDIADHSDLFDDLF